MSATKTSTPALPTALIYPIVKGIAKAYKTPVTFLMIHAVLGAMLIPLLLALFTLSRGPARRSPMFISVVFMVLLGILLSVWNGYVMVHAILSPLNSPSESLRLGLTWLGFSMAWMVDLVLILRVLAIYPFTTTPRIKWLMIMFVPFALKSARIACIIAFFHDYVQENNTGKQELGVGAGDQEKTSTLYRSPYFLALWILQAVDNGFIAGIFLWRLRTSLRTIANFGRLDSNSAKNTFSDRVRMLFWIALSNFLIPVIFNIVQIAIVFSSPYWTTFYLENANCYVSIYGLCFATVWGAASKDSTNSTSYSSNSNEHNRRVRPSNNTSIEPRFVTPVGVASEPIVDIHVGKHVWEDMPAPDGVPLKIMINNDSDRSEKSVV